MVFGRGVKFARGADLSVRTASHIGLWVAVIIIGGFLLWSAFVKRTDVETFAKGASKNETSFTINEGPLSFPCGKFITYDPESGKVKKQ